MHIMQVVFISNLASSKCFNVCMRMMLEVFSVRPPHWYIGISLWSDATHAIYTCMRTTNNKYYYTFCIIFPNRNKEQFYPFFLSQIKKVQLFKVDTLQFSDTFKPIICSNNYVIKHFFVTPLLTL